MIFKGIAIGLMIAAVAACLYCPAVVVAPAPVVQPAAPVEPTCLEDLLLGMNK